MQQGYYPLRRLDASFTTMNLFHPFTSFLPSEHSVLIILVILESKTSHPYNSEPVMSLVLRPHDD